jgi:hypothetical protein
MAALAPLIVKLLALGERVRIAFVRVFSGLVKFRHASVIVSFGKGLTASGLSSSALVNATESALASDPKLHRPTAHVQRSKQLKCSRLLERALSEFLTALNNNRAPAKLDSCDVKKFRQSDFA